MTLEDQYTLIVMKLIVLGGFFIICVLALIVCFRIIYADQFDKLQNNRWWKRGKDIGRTETPKTTEDFKRESDYDKEHCGYTDDEWEHIINENYKQYNQPRKDNT